MPYPFDLERALAGEPLVNSLGNKYTKFTFRGVGISVYYPFSTIDEFGDHTNFSVDGRFYWDSTTERDLQMVYESAEAYKASLESPSERVTIPDFIQIWPSEFSGRKEDILPVNDNLEKVANKEFDEANSKLYSDFYHKTILDSIPDDIKKAAADKVNAELPKEEIEEDPSVDIGATTESFKRLIDTVSDEKLDSLIEKISAKEEKPLRYNYTNYECIVVVTALIKGMELDGVEGAYYLNIMKYLWRFKKKGGKEDLIKAKDYLNWLIDYEK